MAKRERMKSDRFTRDDDLDNTCRKLDGFG